MNLDAVDPTFKEDLRASVDAVWVAARWWSDRGYQVTVFPTVIRESADDAWRHMDHGDLLVGNDVVEVKQRPKLDFRSPADFPFPTIIVDTCHHFDAAQPKPWGYMIFNKALTAFFWIPGETLEQWTRKQRTTDKGGRPEVFYECPLAFCQFCWVGP